MPDHIHDENVCFVELFNHPGLWYSNSRYKEGGAIFNNDVDELAQGSVCVVVL